MTKLINWLSDKSIEFNGIIFEQLIKYPQYYVSESGQIFGMKRARILKSSVRTDGYCTFAPDGISKYIHITVCEHFHPNPDNLPWVNHKDGNKANNTKNNLEWSTISDNLIHKFKILGHAAPQGMKGKKHSSATRDLMASAKIGELHPKFKGWYITPAGRFASSYLAAGPNNLDPKVVYNRCRGIQSYRWKHLGWSFEKILSSDIK